MEKYCQRCGKKIAADEQSCPFCGVFQDRFDSKGETKPCKACQHAIPVNANYCPDCGQDQAIYIYRETEPNSEPVQPVQPETQLENSMANLFVELNPLDLQAEIEKIRQESLRPEKIGKNESQNPSLVTSTKLMLRDWFTYNKRMGRADFWWGMLGLFLITVVVALVVDIGLNLATTQQVRQLFITFIQAWSFVYLVITSTAVMRRLHDLELPSYLVLIYLIPVVGVVVILLLLTRPQVLTTKNQYGFVDPVRKLREKLRNLRK